MVTKGSGNKTDTIEREPQTFYNCLSLALWLGLTNCSLFSSFIFDNCSVSRLWHGFSKDSGAEAPLPTDGAQTLWKVLSVRDLCQHLVKNGSAREGGSQRKVHVQ